MAFRLGTFLMYSTLVAGVEEKLSLVICTSAILETLTVLGEGVSSY